MSRIGSRVQGRAEALVGRPLFWVALVAVIASWPLLWSFSTTLPPPLPVLGRLPRFELVDQYGRPFGTRELEGKVWVASFIFTRCATVCPDITAKMARIQGRTRQLEPVVRLVSFTVDPEYDTPARLAEYARAHRASPRLWSFVTGRPEDVKEAVVKGLKVAMGDEGGRGDPAEISHDSHLVLVDAEGRVRGYYDSEDERVVDRVVRDVGLLVNRGS